MTAAASPQRVLLIQLQQLGDSLLTSALLEDLREALPNARIDFLTRAGGARLLAGNPVASEILAYDADHPIGMLHAIRARRYDLVIDAQSSPRSAPIVLASGAARRVGYAISGPWKLVYTDRIPRDLDPPYFMVKDRQRLVERAGFAVKPRRLRLYITAEERARGREALAGLGTPPGAPRIGMILSAGNPTSVWPPERFAELADRLKAEGYAPVIIRSKGDEQAIARCTALTDAVWTIEGGDLRLFLGLIAGLDLLIGGDSGPVKFAAALDVPTVTLYGPTHAKHWDPAMPITVAVSSPRATCAGCAQRMRRQAPEHTCMLEITVDAVLQGVRQLVPPRRTNESGAPA